MEKVNFSSEKLKNAWEYGKYGFSWPQRNYRCSFCKREFKSAQALGGHMNVHRRERAKMRLLPLGDDHYIKSKPKPKPNPNPNPNPNSFSSSSSSSTEKLLPYINNTYGHHDESCYQNGGDVGENVPILLVRSPVTPPGKVRDLQFLTKCNDSILRKKKEMIRSVNGLNVRSLLLDAKDDLDLELRLGFGHSLSK